MRRKAVDQQHQQHRGAVAVELALIFPLIACIVFTGFEFSRRVLATQSLAMLSNEAAGRAFRECGFIASAQQVSCLNSIASELNQFATTNLPGADVILSVYRSDAVGTVTLVGVGGVNNTGNSPHGYSSRLNATSAQGKFPFLNSNNPVISVGEVFYRQDSISPSIPWIYEVGSQELYDSTVY